MQLKPSRHVPRSHRIHFEGSPKSGKINVRCPSETEFTLIRSDAGWVVTLGSGFARSIHPRVRPHRNPYITYLRAVKVLWGVPASPQPTFEFTPALL
jgi:hypothetical protein